MTRRRPAWCRDPAHRRHRRLKGKGSRDFALRVGGYARDAADLRELLEMCGWLPYPQHPPRYFYGQHRGKEAS